MSHLIALWFHAKLLYMGVTSASQGAPTAAWPQESHVDCAVLPCSIHCDWRFYAFAKHLLWKGEPTIINSRLRVNSAFWGREFVSVGRIMLVLQTRKHKYESALCLSHRYKTADHGWRLLGPWYQKPIGETPDKSKRAHFHETKAGWFWTLKSGSQLDHSLTRWPCPDKLTLLHWWKKVTWLTPQDSEKGENICLIEHDALDPEGPGKC